MMDLMHLEYEKELIKRVRDIIDPDYDVKAVDVCKSNQYYYRGLICFDKTSNQTKSSVVANITKHIDNNTDLDIAAALIVSDFKLHPFIYADTATKLLDIKQARPNIRFKLVNTQRNLKYLKNLETLQILDLTAVMYVVINTDEGGCYSFDITKQIAEKWNLSASDLYEIALDNSTNSQDWSVRDMENVMLEIIAQSPAKVGDPELYTGSLDDVQMYIVTNKSKINGASVILNSQVIKEVYNKIGSDFIILPSSRHEVIVIPATGQDSDSLRKMVYEINRTQVSDEDFLSDNVYFYNSTVGRIEYFV